MRAVAVSEFGATPEVMELPVPEAGPGQVLVRIHAAGLNPFDWQVGDGALRDALPHRFPLVLGMEGAGEVAALGADVIGFAVGDRVFGEFLRVKSGGGSYGEYAVADAGALARIPDAVSYTDAAVLAVAGTTALNLVEGTHVAPGQTVLIVGATGGVGTFATQLAAARGAHVIATARPDAAESMRALGAEETVDHTAGPVAERVLARYPHGVDVLIDVASDKAALVAVAAAVRWGGAVGVSTWAADPEALAARDIRAFNLDNRPTAEVLARVADDVAAGRLRVTVDGTVPLAEAPAALARSRAGRARGKTVIAVA
ncbi:NADP-dependent oxidoreductase [Longispora sp. NPDC051575]|uniref:NADP-dependent oxidoreductase n=1 Tax=Longispora sp. NPDC051575 TaxID=3154943 RepID=UPI003449704E